MAVSRNFRAPAVGFNSVIFPFQSDVMCNCRVGVGGGGWEGPGVMFHTHLPINHTLTLEASHYDHAGASDWSE